MTQEEITIPEDLQQICKDLAKVAQEHKLYNLSGSFSPPSREGGRWGGDIHFNWTTGRHNEDENQIKISSSINIYTQVREKE